MFLSPQNLVHFLLDPALVTAASVVDGDFAVVETSRRNRNFKVLRGPHPGLFVKQAQDWEPYSLETLRREAACYRLAASDPDFAALATLLPRLYHFDPVRHVLVLELLPEGESLGEHHRRLGAFPLEVSAALGRLLGGYHRHAGTSAREAARDAVFPRALPWVLSILENNPSHYGPVSPACHELLAILGEHPEFRGALEEVRAGWRRDALVHGDMKWENCMVLPPAADGAVRIKVIDWELADFGDACWDVGSLFQSYLSAWVFSIRDTGVPPERLPETAEIPLERMQPAMRAFWSAYAGTLGTGAAESAERLRRSMLLGAARMIQTAWEYAAQAPSLAPTVICLLQVSMNVLLRPDDAVAQLLGIEERMAA